MEFTALHRALGALPGPLTDALLDEAVAAGVVETDGLDWKSQLPPVSGLSQTDFPKDVAAMANSGGGVIIFGVNEAQKAATGRVDTGRLSEGHERSLRSAAITAISPPVFGLKVYRLGDNGKRAVVVQVPASVEVPHLVYRNELFGAPVRNDADTVWMKERQIEVMYRARFDERRHATEALDTLFAEASAGRNTDTRAWLIAVAHPRIPRLGDRLDREAARAVLLKVTDLVVKYAGHNVRHPLESVDRLNPRPGLRRWVAVNTANLESAAWQESWMSIHHDGSVTLATAIGGYPKSREDDSQGREDRTSSVEAAVADLMALVRATAEATDNDEYDVRVGINWSGEQPLMIFTYDGFDGASTPLHIYTPVETTVNAVEDDLEYRRHVYELALDCVNQGGVLELRRIKPPEPKE